MSHKVGLLESSRRRSWKSTRVIWLLWVIVLICIFVWFRGFFNAAATDAADLNEYGAGPSKLAAGELARADDLNTQIRSGQRSYQDLNVEERQLLARLADRTRDRGYTSFGQYLSSNGIEGVSSGLLQVEWMWVTGSPRAHNLRAWASSSFPLALVAEGAFLFSIYLRKKGW